MVVSAIFDTLQFAKKAKEVGFTEAQAEFHAEEIARIINENLLTKSDFKVLEKATKMDLRELKKRYHYCNGWNVGCSCVYFAGSF